MPKTYIGLVLTVIALILIFTPSSDNSLREEYLQSQVSIWFTNLKTNVEIAENLVLINSEHANDKVISTLNKAKHELELYEAATTAAHQKGQTRAARIKYLNQALAHIYLGNTDVSIALEFLKENQQAAKNK